MILPRLKRHLFVGLCLLFAVGLCAVQKTDVIPSSPDRWVTDNVGFLHPDTVRDLDELLETYERESGHQILIYVAAATGEMPLEEYAVRAFEFWKVGRKGLDDGLVLFIFSEERTLRIEVGYGLEDDMPDILAARIIDDILVPGFRSGDQDEAVRDAVKVILAAASGDDSPLPEKKKSESDTNVWEDVGLVIIILIILYVFITNPRLAFHLLINILSSGGGSSGRGGRGGGGGGGFSGGGGRSGGGGASGSW
ncbi:MAG: TPM domain-containing protein [Candidatus Aminicenantes bacterium]|nr:TPM domain-containing protein [Candidatus Aminicenantes bacterium]